MGIIVFSGTYDAREKSDDKNIHVLVKRTNSYGAIPEDEDEKYRKKLQYYCQWNLNHGESVSNNGECLLSKIKPNTSKKVAYLSHLKGSLSHDDTVAKTYFSFADHAGKDKDNKFFNNYFLITTKFQYWRGFSEGTISIHPKPELSSTQQMDPGSSNYHTEFKPLGYFDENLNFEGRSKLVIGKLLTAEIGTDETSFDTRTYKHSVNKKEPKHPCRVFKIQQNPAAKQIDGIDLNKIPVTQNSPINQTTEKDKQKFLKSGHYWNIWLEEQDALWHSKINRETKLYAFSSPTAYQGTKDVLTINPEAIYYDSWYGGDQYYYNTPAEPREMIIVK